MRNEDRGKREEGAAERNYVFSFIPQPAVRSPHSAAHDVLARYPALLRQGSLAALGNHGGFSGACLWRVETDGGAYCLRAWPGCTPPGSGAPGRHTALARRCAAGGRAWRIGTACCARVGGPSPRSQARTRSGP